MNSALFDLIAFDADDTLWHNERFYRMGRERFRQMLAVYGVDSASDARLDAIEVRNLPYYGYGVMSFILSLIESGIELTGGRFSPSDVHGLLELGKEMLSADVEVYAHVVEALAALQPRYPLMLITKGEPTNQWSKINRSGIANYFQHIEVVHDKSPAVYTAVLDKHRLQPERFLMVGNSMRSDILPVLGLGSWAVYVPNELTWAHEHVEPSSVNHRRMFTIQHLGELPDLLQQISA